MTKAFLSQSGSWNSCCPRAVIFKVFPEPQVLERWSGGALALISAALTLSGFTLGFLFKISLWEGRVPKLSQKIWLQSREWA